MANCIKCGAETELYSHDVPICPECLDKAHQLPAVNATQVSERSVASNESGNEGASAEP